MLGHPTIHNLAVRGLQKSVFVGPGIHGQRVDQTDVRTFRCLDRANATVMGRVHVTDFEASSLTRQAAWAKRRDATLVRHFRERIVLVHELAQLRGAEELLHCRRDRLRVNHLLRHDRLALGERQTLLHCALNAHETDAERVLGHFADRANTTVAEVIDIVNHAITVANVDQRLQDIHDVRVEAILFLVALRELVRTTREIQPVVEDSWTDDCIATDTTVELHPANRRQVVALRIEEQVMEQVLCGVLRGRLARTHHAIDFDQRFKASAGRVNAQRIRDIRAAVKVVGVQHVDLSDACIDQFGDRRDRQNLVNLGEHFTGVGGEHVVRQHLASQVLIWNRQAINARFFQLANMTRRDATTFFDDHFVANTNFEGCGFAAQTRRNQLKRRALRREEKRVLFEEHIEHLLFGVTESTQHDRDRQLAAAVNTREQTILRVELEVEPRTAVRNDARLEQKLARRVGLALVVVKEHARTAVQLRDDDALGPVHNERSVIGHEREFAQIDFLLGDIAL